VGVFVDAAGSQGQAESPLPGGAAHRLRGGGSALAALTFVTVLRWIQYWRTSSMVIRSGARL
jgi:hypothetical protein